MKRGQARLLLPSDEAEQAEQLIGQAVLWRTSGETSTVQIPLTTAQDVQRVAGLYLAFGSLYVQLIIAEITPRLANLQVTMVGKLVAPGTVRLPDASLLTPMIMQQITVILNTVDRYVQDFLRKAYTLDELKPPPPPLDDHQALFFYQRIYFPHLDDNQFAQLIGVPVQTLRNWRASSGMTQRNFRPTVIDWSKVRPDLTEADIPRWAREEPKRRRKHGR